MADFTKLENLYRMFSSADELVAEKLYPDAGDKDKVQDSESLIRRLTRILIDVESGGASTVESMQDRLNNLLSGLTGDAERKAKEDFNKFVSFYSNVGDGRITASGATSPYTYKNAKGDVQEGIKLHQILGVAQDDLKDKKISICLSRNAFVSPATRNVDKVETFMNCLPSVMLAQCMPYVEAEFTYNRDNKEVADEDLGKLTTPGLLKFLLGGQKIEPAASADYAMYNARRRTVDTPEKGAGGNDKTDDKGKTIYKERREFTSSGMEMFTAPQTLLNNNPDADANRYIPVLNPMLPFATFESLNISVKGGGAGFFSFKTAQAVFKVHDRSRLSEIADFIQPTAIPRTTLWITYGWRFPVSPDGSTSRESLTYADFINNNMLIKEAYGVRNSSFSFDQSGQVTVTLELYTLPTNQLRVAQVQDGSPLMQAIKKQKELAAAISQVRSLLNFNENDETAKEVRGYQIIDAAASNQFLDFDPRQTAQDIAKLKQTFKNFEADMNAKKKDANFQVPEEQIRAMNSLIAALELFFKPGSDKTKFLFKEQRERAIDTYLQERLKKLEEGEDPFLYFPEKHEKFIKEAGYKEGSAYPYASTLDANDKTVLSDKVLADYRKKYGTKQRFVSFGKLFSIIMGQALLDVTSIDEVQVFFYNLNGLAGLASATNIAEFAIDVPYFLQQYKAWIETNETTAITVEQFVKLAVDSQFSDNSAAPFGFRPYKIFKPGENNGPATLSEGVGSMMPTIELSINSGMGSFQPPQVAVYMETLFLRDKLPEDMLAYYNSPEFNLPGKKALKIHIFDKGLSPYLNMSRVIHYTNNTSGTDIKNNQEAYRLNPYIPAQKVTQEVDFNKDTPREEVRAMVTRLVPSIIPGTNASAVQDVSLSTAQDALLSTAQMLKLNSGKNLQATPRGASPFGLPLRVIPAKLSMRTVGCPILNYAQSFFVDMNTGTSIDNIYNVIGISHSFSPGKFDSNIEFGFADAYGRYEPRKNLTQGVKELTDAVSNLNTQVK